MMEEKINKILELCEHHRKENIKIRKEIEEMKKDMIKPVTINMDKLINTLKIGAGV